MSYRPARATSSGGGGASTPTPFGMVSGRWYGPQALSRSGGVGFVNGWLYFVPILIPTALTLDRIAIEVTTAASSTNCRIGIYDDADAYPNDLVAELGSVDVSTTGEKILTISQALSAARHWLAVVPQGGGPQLRFAAPNSTWIVGGTSASSGSVGAYKLEGESGALPASVATPSALGIVTNAPWVAIRIA